MVCRFQIDTLPNGRSADGLRLGVIPGTRYDALAPNGRSADGLRSGLVGTAMERQERQVERNLAKSNVLAQRFDIERRLSDGRLAQSTATRTTASLAAPGT
jgi:hypothetical protein